jgi:amino acid permease
MDLLVTLFGMVVDLTGALNPLRWLGSQETRGQFRQSWRQSRALQKMGFVFGCLLYVAIIAALLGLLVHWLR